MQYQGDFHKGQSVYINFSTFAAAGGNVAPSDAFENADVRVYENGSATQITAGITVTSPFDSLTGFHQVVIATSDAAYTRGKDYVVVLAPDTETVDSQTITAVPIGSFSIENRSVPASFRTTIATVNSQTSIVLTDGPAEDDALNGCGVWVKDAATSHQISKRAISDYVGSTKTVTLSSAPDFTIAVGDVLEVVIGFLDQGVTLQANAVSAAALATDAVSEIQSGLATAAALATVDTIVDAILVDTDTTIPGLVTTVDTVVDAIKAKTDSLTFTQAGHVDANIQRINDVAIVGDGSGTPFDV